MRPLLERLPILRCQDFSSAEAFLAARHIALEPSGATRDRALFDVQYNGIYLPGLWLGYIAYGSSVTARILPEREDFWVHVPLQGRLESAVGRQRVEADARRGVMTSPSTSRRSGCTSATTGG